MEEILGGEGPGFAVVPTTWWALKAVFLLCFPGTSFQAMHGGQSHSDPYSIYRL